MSVLGTIRATLAQTIEDQTDGLAVYQYATENLIAPAAIVFLPTIVDYRQTFAVLGQAAWMKLYLIPVQIRVSYADPLAANDALDDWVEKVTAAILNVPNLDGAVDSIDVVSVDSFGTIDVDTISYLACNVNVEILA